MQEQLVTFETVQLLQQKDCNLTYCKCGGFPECICGDDLKFIPQSLLQKWLREVHNIEISVRAIKWENTELKTGLVLDSYEYEMYPLKQHYYIYHKIPGFKTYEEALEIGLQEALKLI